jgi:hypothetical protein
MVFAMKRDLEIFRGSGAVAALEAATIRALLESQGIPVCGGRMSIVVAAKDYARACQLVSAAFGTGAAPSKATNKPKRGPVAKPAAKMVKRVGAA